MLAFLMPAEVSRSFMKPFLAKLFLESLADSLKLVTRRKRPFSECDDERAVRDDELEIGRLLDAAASTLMLFTLALIIIASGLLPGQLGVDQKNP